MEETTMKKENIKEVSDLKVKKDLLKVEVVNSDKYVGSDWCSLVR